MAALFWFLAETYLGLAVGEIPPPLETPNLGLLHPDHPSYFESPRQYLDWYRQTHPEAQSWPVVGLLFYRKHVITQQPYIPQLIRLFEQAELVPLPIFINGVEGHVAVRDLLTSAYETAQRRGGSATPSPSRPRPPRWMRSSPPWAFPWWEGQRAPWRRDGRWRWRSAFSALKMSPTSSRLRC